MCEALVHPRPKVQRLEGGPHNWCSNNPSRELRDKLNLETPRSRASRLHSLIPFTGERTGKCKFR